MPDWLIPITALLGALAGAALQPVTTYAMDRLRSRERIRKGRERTLRRMLEQKIEVTQRHRLTLTVVWAFRKLGRPAPTLQDMLQTQDFGPGGLLFSPARISDPELRAKATEYSGLVSDLAVAIWFQQPDADAEEKLLPLSHQLEELEEAIVLRMDQLGWPHDDD